MAVSPDDMPPPLKPQRGWSLQPQRRGVVLFARWGLYAGSCSNPYRSNIPPIHVWIPILRQHGYDWAADMLATAHGLDL